MNDRFFQRLGCCFMVAGLCATAAAHADALRAVDTLRLGGCGGVLPAARPLQHIPKLDRIAALWAGGEALALAADRSGYAVAAINGIHIRGAEAASIDLLKRSGCQTVADKSLQDIGAYRRGADTWLILAAAYAVPGVSQAPLLAAKTLQLINQVRAKGARCGERSFGPAPPVRLSETLAEVAYGHAIDMAQHNYFEHEDRAGHTPADRVRAVGYREKLVGENIAYGPQSAEEVVQGWLDSPGHCENIMDARFAEMGVAFAPGQASKRGLYWVQLLAAPRA
jgi:uncharacterized protein YkwD